MHNHCDFPLSARGSSIATILILLSFELKRFEDGCEAKTQCFTVAWRCLCNQVSLLEEYGQCLTLEWCWNCYIQLFIEGDEHWAVQTHGLEGGQGWSNLECMLLCKCAWTVNDIVLTLRHLYLGRLTHIDTEQVEIPDFLSNRLRHVLMRLWHTPSL